MFRVYADGVSIFDPANKSLTLHSPKVSVEVGKAGSFQFIIPPTNEHYDDINQLSTSIVVEYENDTTPFEIFRGRVFSVTTDFNKCKTVVCEGNLAYLVDTIQQAKTYKGSSKKLLGRILAAHNEMVLNDYGGSSANLPDSVKRKIFNLGRFEIDDATVVIPGPKEDEDEYYTAKYAQAIIESIANEWVTTYDYINDVIINYLGGYLVARYDNSTGSNYLDVMSDESLSDDYKAPEEAQTRQIEFGTNLLDISQEFNPEDLCTVVIPIGDTVDDKPLTIAKATNAKSDENYEVVSINNKKIGIKHKAAAERYGLIYKTHNFSNVNNPNTLFTDGKRWLKRNRNIPTRFTIKAVDMTFVNSSSDASPIRLGEMVSARSGPHNIDIQLLCTKIEYDLENPANNAYTLGNPEQTLTERYRKNKDKEKKSSKAGSRRAGTAAAKAANAAQTTADDALNKVVKIGDDLGKANIIVDPENSAITLSTWYKTSKDAMQRAGIDIDGKKGSVDIYAMYDDIKGNISGIARLTTRATESESAIEGLASRTDQYGEQLSKLALRVTDSESVFELLAQHNSELATTAAGINALADDTKSELDLFASWKDKTNENINSMADIKLKADADGAAIEQYAKWQKGIESSMAQLNIRANKLESMIEQIATFTSASAETTASIKAQADANGSKIEMINTFVDKATNELRGLAETKQWVNDHEAGIRSATEWYAENGTSSLTNISQLSNDKISQILQAASFVTENSSALSSIKAWSTEDASNIRSAAEFTNRRDENGERELVSSSAQIKQIATANGSKLDLIADFKDNGKGTYSVASIKLSADLFGSIIKQNADKIYLDSSHIYLGTGTGKMNNYIQIKDSQLYLPKTLSVASGATFTKITASKDITTTGSIYASNIYIQDPDATTNSGSKVATETWVTNKKYATAADLKITSDAVGLKANKTKKTSKETFNVVYEDALKNYVKSGDLDSYVKKSHLTSGYGVYISGTYYPISKKA